MPRAGNIAKTMTSNGKQFTVTREMLTVAAGISARYSKFAFVLFCYITNHLMTGPLGNSEFCFPRISMFPSTSSRETLRFSGNKIHCSPRDQSLSVYYHIRFLTGPSRAKGFATGEAASEIRSGIQLNCSPILSQLCHSCSRLRCQNKSTRARNTASCAGYKLESWNVCTP